MDAAATGVSLVAAAAYLALPATSISAFARIAA